MGAAAQLGRRCGHRRIAHGVVLSFWEINATVPEHSGLWSNCRVDVELGCRHCHRLGGRAPTTPGRSRYGYSGMRGSWPLSPSRRCTSAVAESTPSAAALHEHPPPSSLLSAILLSTAPTSWTRGTEVKSGRRGAVGVRGRTARRGKEEELEGDSRMTICVAIDVD